MRRALAAAALAICAVAGAAQAQPVAEPAGFHGEPYRAAVPPTLAGAQVASDAQARALHAQGVPFIDVLPRQKRPQGLPEGTLWNAPPHLTIPGAMWLYDTGYDRLAAAEEARLQEGLARATHGDKARAVVIFCKTDCWMSWNAAKRAVGMGYRGVVWFPGGTDGWLRTGGTLTNADLTGADAP